MAELGHLLQDGAHALRAFGREEERAVDLHRVEREVAEQGEVAVAAAEIVHVDAEAEAVQRGDDGERVLALRRAREVERRLRELERDAVRRIFL